MLYGILAYSYLLCPPADVHAEYHILDSVFKPYDYKWYLGTTSKFCKSNIRQELRIWKVNLHTISMSYG